MTRRLERLRRRLSEPVCGQSLAAFRIAFGLLMLHDTVYVLRAGWLTRYYVERDILFPYFGVEVPALPEPWLHGLWAACTACCVLVALGALYRLAIWVFNAVFTYFFLLDQVVYLNHFYMIILFGVLLGFTDAHRCWSLDRRLGRRAGARKVPAWNVVVLGFQIEVVLVFAGLVKIEVDWLRGEPLRQWMLERTWSPLSALFEIHWITLAAPVLVILLHVVGAPLLLWSRTRLWVFLAYCAFHLANAHLFVIGVFPWLTIAATTLLFPTDWPSALARRAGGFARRALLAAAQKRGYSANSGVRFQRSAGLRAPSWLPRPWRRIAGPGAAADPEPACVRPLGPAAFGALLLFAAVQILVPLRSFLYEGPVEWTEKGQKFAWRMMMYSAAGDGGFLVVSPGGDAWAVPPGAHLDRVQSYQVLTKPEVLLHFVGKLAEHHAGLGHGEVRIYGDIRKSVNGKPFQRFVDPRVDLASVEGMRWFGDEPWLLRPEPSQAAEGLVPDWYPPITAARFGAMLDALRDRQPSRATEGGAGGARGRILTQEAGGR